MGGSTDKIRLVAVGKDANVQQAILDDFKSFDVQHARCFLDVDTERLHGVIEEGFGELSRFNTTVCEMFANIAGQGHFGVEPPNFRSAFRSGWRLGSSVEKKEPEQALFRF